MKYGCALWNVNGNKKAIEELDKIKPTIIKRVLKLPLSTPSAAIQSEFGINDLSLDVLIEKVILAVETLNRDDDRKAKQLLVSLMEKNVDGFCTEVTEACEILNVSMDDLCCAEKARLDVSAVGVWGPMERTFLDVRVMHPNSLVQ